MEGEAEGSQECTHPELVHWCHQEHRNQQQHSGPPSMSQAGPRDGAAAPQTMVTLGWALLSVPQEDNVGAWERPPAPFGVRGPPSLRLAGYETRVGARGSHN